MINTSKPRPHARTPLEQLIASIVSDSSSEALIEFHDHRTLFFVHDRHHRLADYLQILREAAVNENWGQKSDEAYSLTIDKFSRIPDDGESGIDCRNYFRAALAKVPAAEDQSMVDREIAQAGVIQRLVYRHFRLSLREIHRNGDMTRYQWHLEQGMINIRLPRQLVGSHRREWLHDNIPDPDPSRPNETFRVQSIIDEHFGSNRRQAQPLEDELASDSPTYFSDSFSVTGLASAIATEKAERRFELRPSIQKLGKKKIERLVSRIFEQLASGEYDDTSIARAFNLSKSTFSRFAGSNWNGRVPDLFINTARALTTEPAYAEAIRDAGFWEHAKRMDNLCQGSNR